MNRVRHRHEQILGSSSATNILVTVKYAHLMHLSDLPLGLFLCK